MLPNTQFKELVGATCRAHCPYCSEANPYLVWLPPSQCAHRRTAATMVRLFWKVCSVTIYMVLISVYYTFYMGLCRREGSYRNLS